MGDTQPITASDLQKMGMADVYIYCGKQSSEITRLRAEVEELTDALTRNGFRRCNIAACNCGSWHYEGGYRQRFNEFVEALSEAGHPLSNENGNTPLRALGELIAEVEALRADAQRWRYINERNGEWRRFEADGSDPAYSMLCVRLPYDADLSCKATREIAIDAARAAQEPKR